MLARSTAPQITRMGGDKCFLVAADFVFGQQLAQDATAFVLRHGGRVTGGQRLPAAWAVRAADLIFAG